MWSFIPYKFFLFLAKVYVKNGRASPPNALWQRKVPGSDRLKANVLKRERDVLL